MNSPILKLWISSLKLHVATTRKNAAQYNEEANHKELFQMIHESTILEKILLNGALFNLVQSFININVLSIWGLTESCYWGSILFYKLLRINLADFVIFWQCFYLTIFSFAFSECSYCLIILALATCKLWSPFKNEMAIVWCLQFSWMSSVLN